MKKQFFVGLAGATLAIFLPVAQAKTPWDTPFAADTAAVSHEALALQSPSGQPVVLLLDESRYSIDKSGRLHYDIRRVYRILSEDGKEDWASVQAPYQPWHAQMPRLRARVITKDGAVHMLDPRTVSDSPAREAEDNVFSDGRVVRAPLPAIEIGSIVEYEIDGDESPALAGAGILRRISVTDYVPLERFHVHIEAAKGAPVVHIASGLIPPSAIHQENGPQTVIDVELSARPARTKFESGLPPDVAAVPWFAFSTSSSWSALAGLYSDIVDRQIANSDLKGLLDGLDLTGKPADIAARLATRLHRQIRYTGVELAEAALVPATPGEVLLRKYGDCKDKSTLLVAMLRAAGLKANLALLDAEAGTDVDRDLPGLDGFNHAIVYVDSTPPLWLDATASDFRIGTLPPDDQVRLALIARHGSAALTATPDLADAWHRRTFEIQVSSFGPGDIEETREGSDSTEANLRAAYGRDESKNAESLKKYVKDNYRAKSLGAHSVSGGDDLSLPFVVRLVAAQTPQVVTGDDGARVELAPWQVLDELPYAFREPAPDDGDKRTPRVSDYYFREAVSFERVFKLRPPALFKVSGLPASKDVAIGPLQWSRVYKSNPDGSVEADFKLTCSKRRLTPAEFEAVYKTLHDPATAQNDAVLFVPATAEYVAAGQIDKALALLREDIRRHGAEAGSHIRMARTLLIAGMGGAARAEARIAVTRDPDSGLAWQTLGWILQHDIFGRRFEGDWDPAESEKSYRKAVAIEPDDIIPQTDLAILLEHNERGVRYGRGSRLDEAAALYRQMLDKQENAVIRSNLIGVLIMAGRVDDALDAAKKSPDTAQARIIAAVSVAIHEGPGRAVLELQSQYPDPASRAQQLAGTALVLMRLRRYDDARALLTAASRGGNAQQLVSLQQIMNTVKKREDALLPDSDPRSVMQRFMLPMLEGDVRRERFEPLFARPDMMDGFEEDAKGALNNFMGPAQRQLGSLGLSEENLADIAMGVLSLKSSGGDESHGFRVTLEAPTSMTAYVVRQDGAMKILGLSESAEDIGKLVLDLLDRKQIEAAQWWLDLVVKDIQSKPGDPAQPAVRSLWSGVVPETRGPDAIRRAAASLIGRFTKSPQAIAILEQELAKAKTADKAELQLALCEAYLKSENWPGLLKTAQELGKLPLFSSQAFSYFAKAAEAQKQWKELEKAAQARIDDKTFTKVKVNAGGGPSEPFIEPEFERSLIVAKMNLGDYAGAAPWIEKYKGTQAADALTFEVWAQMLSGKIADPLPADPPALGGAPRPAIDPFARAAAQLVLKHPDEARDSLKLAIGDKELPALDARAWAIDGLLAKEWGLDDEAAALWKRAASAKGSDETASWSLALIPRP